MTNAVSAPARVEAVLAPRIKGRWLTTGDPLDLLRASRIFSQAHRLA